MDVLRGQEALSTASQDAYVRTHPLSSDRISFLEEHVRKSPYSDVPADPDLVKLHNRMRAKLIAFIEPPPRTFRAFPDSDRSPV
ncbi:MAG: M48 family peptidase, partial [Rhodospirillales bacterium]|nr:M48 family peptidase [Rhodospirillales bacterium]